MRYIWLAFLGLAVLIGLVSWLKQPAGPGQGTSAPAAPSAPPAANANRSVNTSLTSPLAPRPVEAVLPGPPRGGPLADSLVRFALRHRGVPYRWAGTTPEGGFDCSGFLMYAYAHVGVPLPHSTALLIDTGQPVPRANARPGDLVVFTGTAPTSTTPGHAGIIISANGEVPMRFVHSSSARRESGVKISQVEGTDYERRFMQVRRVLGGAQLATVAGAAPERASPARVPTQRRLVAVVAPLETRPAAVQIADETEPPPPPARLTLLARKPVAKRAPLKTQRRTSSARKRYPKTGTKATNRRPAPKVAPKPTALTAAKKTALKPVSKARKSAAKPRR